MHRNVLDVRLYLCFVAMILVSSAYCQAEALDEQTLFQEIPSVFGASKYDQKLEQAPSSVTIVTADEISKYGYRTLGDILRSQRSFYVTNDDNYEYLGVRGFSPPGDYNSRILVLVDGHRINDNIYGSAGIEKSFSLSIDLIDRVEIIRGPSSSIYGTSAFFAVVNIISKRGRDYQGFEVAGLAASHDTYEGRMTYGKKLPGGVEFILSGAASDSDGENWYYPEFDDPSTNFGRAVGIDREEHQELYLKASYLDFSLTGSYVNREKQVPTAPWGTVFNDPGLVVIDERFYLDINYQTNLFEGWHVLSNIYYDYYYYEGDYPYDWPPVVTGKDEAEGEWWGGDIQLSKQFATHRLAFGAQYQENLQQDQSYLDDKNDPSSIIVDVKNSSDFYAFYIQDEIDINDKLSLSLGLRHDDYSTFGSNISPRVALIYEPVQGSTLKLLYGEAFRAPSEYELHYTDGPTYQKDNPELKPENIQTYEVVWEQKISENLRSTVSGFYYEATDLITNSEDPVDLNPDGEPVTLFLNAAEVSTKGCEIELSGDWDNGLKGQVSYTFQEAKNEETDEWLTNSPKHLAKVNLILPLWNNMVFAGIEEQYVSERKTLSGARTDAYTITNLTLFSQSLVEGLDLALHIDNVFDEKIYDPGGEEHLQDEIEQSGRAFNLKMVYSF